MTVYNLYQHNEYSVYLTSSGIYALEHKHKTKPYARKNIFITNLGGRTCPHKNKKYNRHVGIFQTFPGDFLSSAIQVCSIHTTGARSVSLQYLHFVQHVTTCSSVVWMTP